MEENLVKRIMPHSQEAEQSVIGSMIIDKEAIAAATELLTADDFYEKTYGLLFDAMVGLYNEGKSVDVVTLQDRLRQLGAPPQVSSLEYVGGLLSATPTSVNVREYAQIVKDKAQMRSLIRVNEEISNTCYGGQEPVNEIMEDAEKKIFQVLQSRSSGDFVPIKQVVVNALQAIQRAALSKGSVTGLATGFKDLDYKTAGFQNSDLILIAARPSMGKTAFVLNIAQHMAVHEHVPVMLFSLEMSKEQLVNRLFAMEARVDAQLLRNGRLTDSDWESLMDSANLIADSNLIIDDTPGISVAELRSKCRKYKLEHQIGIIMIDYLQLMQGSKRVESRQQEISEISRSLKEIARELQVPVVALSQLSRAVEQRPDHRPMLSDLRESGAIEQDADVVMFLYREDYYNHDTEKKDVAEVIIAKQRNGPIGTVELAWIPKFTRFASLENTRRGDSQGE